MSSGAIFSVACCTGRWISFEVGMVSVALAGLFGVLLRPHCGLLGRLARYLAHAGDGCAVCLSRLAARHRARRGARHSLRNVFIAISVTNMPTFMRIVRGSVLAVRRTPYVEAATAVGVSTPRILARHIFPNVTPPLIVHPRSPSHSRCWRKRRSRTSVWATSRPRPRGGRCSTAATVFLETAPWVSILPGAPIALTVLGFNLLGDGMRDALDPRLR